jgi:hypothetical protein
MSGAVCDGRAGQTHRKARVSRSSQLAGILANAAVPLTRYIRSAASLTCLAKSRVICLTV